MDRVIACGRGRASWVAAVIALGACAPALTINRNLVAAGQDYGFGLGSATGAPTTNIGGGGNLVSIFNAAADCWEKVILDTHTVSLNYGWQGLSGNTLGVHVLTGQGGAPHRETSGIIRFDSDGSAPFFLDSTPNAHEEFTAYTPQSQDLGGGTMNTGRWFHNAIGAAVNRFDLFTIALHEIGHALGLSSANTAFQAEAGDGDIDVTAPRPHAGASIPLVSGAHTNVNFSLMFPGAFTSERLLMADVDTIANAQISQFTNLDLDACIIPEPTTIAVLGLGLLAVVKRRRQ